MWGKTHGKGLHERGRDKDDVRHDDGPLASKESVLSHGQLEEGAEEGAALEERDEVGCEGRGKRGQYGYED